LNKKIQGFNDNKDEIANENKSKAGDYLGQINERESELNAVRTRLLEQEDEMKNLSITREKFRIEREFLINELKGMERAMKDLS